MSIALNPESDSMVGSAPLSGKQTPDLYHNTPHKSSAGFSGMDSHPTRFPRSVRGSHEQHTAEEPLHSEIHKNSDIRTGHLAFSVLLFNTTFRFGPFFTQSYSLTSTPQSMSIFRISVYPLLHAKDRALSLPLARRLGSAPCSEDVCTQKKVSVYSSYLYSIYQYALNEGD